MATAQDLCTRAALNLGAVQNGEPLTTAETTVILAALNALLDSESIQRDSIYRVSKVGIAFNLNPNVRDYTMGINGANPNISIERPDFISSVSMVVSGTFGTPTEQVTLLNRIEDGDWPSYPNKLYASAWPTSYYVDWASPAITISFLPVPTVARQINIFVGQNLPRVVNLTDDLLLPRGYERFLASNLALEIQPMFPGTQVSPQLMKIAEDSRNAVRNYNRKQPPRIFSSSMLTKGDSVSNDIRVRSMRP